MRPERTIDGAILDNILPEHERISRARDSGQLEDEADRRRVSVERVFEEERAREYKAIDRMGNVWLVRNPAAWRARTRDGMTFLERPKPRHVLTYKQAISHAEVPAASAGVSSLMGEF